MRRLRISAFLLTAFLAVGCSKNETTDSDRGSDEGGDEGDDKGGTDKGRDGGPNKRDGGPGSNGKDGSKEPVKPVDIDKSGSPFEQDDTGNSGLSDGDIDKLKEGGGDCDEGFIRYPYDGVVFPVGLAPPTIMFAEPVDGSYLKLTYAFVDNIKYETAADNAVAREMSIPAEPWLEVLRRTKGQELEATISYMRGGKVSTCNYKWRAAQGALTGSLYYNTYNHPDLLGFGAVMRLNFGQPESEVYLKYEGVPFLTGPCISCHSVSFNGEKMAASTHNYNPLSQSFATNSYTLSDDSIQPKPTSPLPESTFAGFVPDGSRMLAMGNPDCTAGSDAFPRTPNNFPLLLGPTQAAVHNTETGEVMPSSGLKPEWYMWMPQFSPDGKHVVFNHAKPGGPGGFTDRRELAMMDYEQEGNKFTNLRSLVKNQGPEPTLPYAPLGTASGPIAGTCTPANRTAQGQFSPGACDGPCFPGWPFFTPDGLGVVYVLSSEPDFVAAMPGRDHLAMSELWYVDVETGEKQRLDNANRGLKAEDDQHNYYPTMLPVSVGGYFWLFWTTPRDWGIRDTNPTASQIGTNFWGGAAVLTAARKRIWVSAIRPRQQTEFGLEALYDFSAPGFYLEGQSASGNIRGFAALNPCKQDGEMCKSGIDCCSGYCEIEKDADWGSCVPEKLCSELKERCKTDENCCPVPDGAQPIVCISGYCDYEIR